MMQKYDDLLANLPLSNPQYLQHVIKDTPILAAIQKSLLAKTVQEVEVKDEPEEDIIDPNAALKNLTDLNAL